MAEAIWPWVSVFPDAPCIRQSAIPDALRTTLLDRCRKGEGSMVEGAGSENGPYTRWGDYSAMRVDPSDDCTFWYTTEYYATTSGSFNWRTQIASFQFPSCGTTHFSVSAPANTTAGNP